MDEGFGESTRTVPVELRPKSVRNRFWPNCSYIPHRDYQVCTVYCGKLGAKTYYRACSSWGCCPVKNFECSDKLTSRINRSFDLYRVKHAVTFQDHINFFIVFIPVIPEDIVFGSVFIGFYYLRQNIVFKNVSGQSAICKNLR